MKKEAIYINAEDVRRAKELENDEKAIEGLTEKAVNNSLSNPKKSMVSREKDRRYLKHEFSIEEKRAASEELARAVNEKESAESELKSIKSQFDSRKKLAEEAILKYAQQISTGYEYRQTEVEIVKDFTLGTVTIWRLDTDEIVETHRMTGADRQMSLTAEEV